MYSPFFIVIKAQEGATAITDSQLRLYIGELIWCGDICSIVLLQRPPRDEIPHTIMYNTP